MECPVCFEIFRNPLLLPGCGHTVCGSCAELLVTEGNFLRCPECRLVYQLRRGVKSLPKNVALQRTIDEHLRANSGVVLMCDSHPEDAISLYCRTCEKGICLKCYFTNTLRKGESLHAGHQVDTSEDVYSRERRLLEEKCHEFQEKQKLEIDYIDQLKDSEKKLQSSLEAKSNEIDRKKNELISHVKQTAAKLKFTLNGSVVRDMECLKTSLEAAEKRLSLLETALVESVEMLNKASNDCPEIRLLKAARQKLDSISFDSTAAGDHPSPSSFSKLDKFDTDIQQCLDDPKKALSYQTESPRIPALEKDDCVVSDISAYIPIRYNETVRTKRLVLRYKEALYKGMSEKEWDEKEADDLKQGTGRVLLTGLKRGTMYKTYAVASNEFGESPVSNELWFRTVDGEIDARVISK